MIDLLNLHSDNDKTWRQWIRCGGKYLTVILTKFLKKYPNFKFSFQVTPRRLREWKNGKYFIPLWIFRDICKYL